MLAIAEHALRYCKSAVTPDNRLCGLASSSRYMSTLSRRCTCIGCRTPTTV